MPCGELEVAGGSIFGELICALGLDASRTSESGVPWGEFEVAGESIFGELLRSLGSLVEKSVKGGYLAGPATHSNPWFRHWRQGWEWS